MKKIALTLVAASALGLAACGGTTAHNNTASNEVNATSEALSDLDNATMDANAAASSANASANAAGDAAADANASASDASNAASNAH